jgi:hypothetical protein
LKLLIKLPKNPELYHILKKVPKKPFIFHKIASSSDFLPILPFVRTLYLTNPLDILQGKDLQMETKFNVNNARPIANLITPQLIARMESLTTVMHSGCHEFSKLDYQGYGWITIEGKSYRAHRVSYTIAKGEIPNGLVMDHLCRNTSCVNPKHLEPVTPSENLKRGNGVQLRQARTECPRGHKLEGDNIIPSFAKKGFRACRSCDNASRSVRRLISLGRISPAEKETALQAASDYTYKQIMEAK